MDYEDKFNTTLTNISKVLIDLRNKFTKLESDFAVSKIINNKLSSQLINVERKCWANEQYKERNVWKFPDSIFSECSGK